MGYFQPREDRVYCTGDIFHLAKIRYTVDSDSSYTVLHKCHEAKGYPFLCGLRSQNQDKGKTNKKTPGSYSKADLDSIYERAVRI